MENASKALIIAGAILLSILIIGLGMLIFNQAKDAIGNTGMDEQKAAAYNDPFLSYEGENVKGSQVKTLCDKVRSHNIQAGSDDSLYISINNESDVDKILEYKATIKQGKTYKIEVLATGYDKSTGFINNISITQNP